MKTIIGLVGVKQSGKSTTASIIKKYCPNAQETALADKLKDVCARVFNLSRECFDDQRYKEIPFKIFKIYRILQSSDIVTILSNFHLLTEEYQEKLYKKYLDAGLIDMELESPRHIAQIVGTQILREAGSPDVHCENVNIDGDLCVITDLRFSNEFDYFHNKLDINFIPIYVSRDIAEAQVTEKSHISEREVFLFRDKCIRLDNNGTLEGLETKIQTILISEGIK